MSEISDQLSLFEIEKDVSIEVLQSTPFALEDRVQIVIPDYKRNDPESFHYLESFVGKPGIVSKAVKQPNLQYEVDVGNRIAFVFHDELVAGFPL